MDVKNLTISGGLAVALIGTSVTGAIWVGEIQEKVQSQEAQTKRQWQLYADISNKQALMEGQLGVVRAQFDAAEESRASLKEAINELKAEIRRFRTSR